MNSSIPAAGAENVRDFLEVDRRKASFHCRPPDHSDTRYRDHCHGRRLVELEIGERLPIPRRAPTSRTTWHSSRRISPFTSAMSTMPGRETRDRIREYLACRPCGIVCPQLESRNVLGREAVLPGNCQSALRSTARLQLFRAGEQSLGDCRSRFGLLFRRSGSLYGRLVGAIRSFSFSNK